jgi:uncharacterized BrkB/YihY/UPF0761 family membrane protein
MSSYFEKLSEYYRSDKAEQDNNRFIRQAKNSFISSIIIIGVVLFLVIVVVVIMGIQSIFS